MTAYVKTTPGRPAGGLYTAGDTVTDSIGIVWKCIVSGYAGGGAVGLGVVGSAEFMGEAPYDSTGVAATSALGVVATVTGLTAEEYSNGAIRHTRLTLAAVAQVIPNGASEFVGTSLYTFPEGRILVLGTVATLAPTTTSTLATTVTSGSTGSVALGTVVATNASLTSTMVDLAPATAYTSSTTINVAAAAVSPVLAASAQFDGTTTAKALFLNNSVAVNSADGTITWAGVIDFTWVLLGDK